MSLDGSGDAKRAERSFERHLDLLLAEEIECRPAFARWLLDRGLRGAMKHRPDPIRIEVRIGWTDPSMDGVVAGEDDLFVTASWSDGTRSVLLIEDKLDAVLQRGQVERYLGRVAAHRQRGAVAGAMVVAPQAYLDARRQELGGLVHLAIEDLARRLEADADTIGGEIGDRLRWRSARLARLREGRRTPAIEHGPTIDLCRRMTAFLNRIGSQAGPNPRTLRTANTTWLFFRHGWGLVFKIPAGVVDIYPAKLWPSEDRSSWTAQPPQGFEAAPDGEGNLVLRWSLSERPDFDAMLVDGNIGPVEDALRACDAASRWIDERTSGRMSN